MTLLNYLTKFLLKLVIPLTISDEYLLYLKGPVFAFLFSLIVFGFVGLLTISIVLLTPVAAASGFLNSLTNSSASINEGFTQSQIPSRNPLGGSELEYTTITAGFLDPSYFLKFGKNHTGIDLVPNDNYFKNSQTYKGTHKIIVFATHSGIVNFYTDGNGGETIEITNSDNAVKTVYIHFKSVFVSTGSTVETGQSIGEMGKTGFATGEHVHYEVRIRDGSGWLAVNPLSYIQ